MGKHRVFLALTALELVVLVGLGMWGRGVRLQRTRQERPAKRVMVRVLGLTDLALWTEARYTRHPSQADLFAAFEDFPSALEHFPAGSIVPVPRPRTGPARPGG
jgi:hypothetical protein